MSEKERNPFDPPGGFRNVGRIVFYVLSVLLIGVLIAVLFSVTVLRKKGEPPSVFGFSVYIVATDSMEPAISPGSALLVRKTDPGKLVVDDVITFKEGYNEDGQLLINTHRIVEIVESGGERAFRTKGDKSAAPDEQLRYADDILGRAVSYMPGIGRFFAFVKTPLGLVCCIAVPLLILLVFEVINLIRLSRRSKEEELEAEEEEAQQGPLAMAVSRRRELFAADTAPELTEEPPPAIEHPPFAFQTPVQTGPELPAGEAPVQQTVLGSAYGFAVPAEQEDVPLEVPAEEGASPVKLSYDKREAEPPPRLHSTQEFALHALHTPAESPADTAPAQGSAPEPAPEQPFPVTPAASPVEPDPAFLANVASQGKDRFKIDGIDVHVQPDSIKLALEGDREERDISITVTEEYTNVTVGTEGHEVNFALFRDEKGQKVIIQKKAR